MKYFSSKTQHLRQNFLFGFLAVGLFLALPVLTLAAPGDLDSTFGNGGIVSTGQGLDTAHGMAIQADGKIVVVGTGGTDPNNSKDFAVARYNPNGSLDTSFGGTGVVFTQTGGGGAAYSVAIQSDGKIIAAGSSECNSFTIIRYNPNGSLDTSFGGNGVVITTLSFFENAAYSVAIQADGKIVAAGTSDNISSFDFAIVRYNPNGSLDTSFDGDGVTFTRIENVSAAYSLAIQADGKIVAAGYSGNSHFAVVRYNPNGSLDTSFGGTGIVITQTTGGYFLSGANSVKIQTDGKIVAVGNSGNFANNSNFTLVRYNTDGSLDSSFNGTGIVVTPVGNSCSFANSVAIQADGKIVAAGSSCRGGYDFAVVRYNGNGSLDTTFNGTGKVITPISGGNDYAASVAIQADGKIVAAGSTSSKSDLSEFTLVRYQGGSNANIRTRFDFDGDGRADISVFRPSSGVWYLNQSSSGFSATQFGLSTDKLTPADFDGDGRTDTAVYRDGIWYWLNSSDNSFNALQFGLPSDIPVPADYTGDGQAEIAVWRPSSGIWYVWNLSTNQYTGFQFGASTDKPVLGDYDGDSRADYAVYRPSNGIWYIQQSTNGFTAAQFGLETDRLVPADYDGDGKTDIAVYRDGTWYLRQSSQGFTAFQFGNASDIPAPADFDGDGRADASVFRNGIWYLRQSTNGVAVTQFGLANDQPIPTAFVP